MSYAWIAIVVIVLFLAYQVFKWFGKEENRKQFNAIIKTFSKEKDKILDGQPNITDEINTTPIHDNKV